MTQQAGLILIYSSVLVLGIAVPPVGFAQVTNACSAAKSGTPACVTVDLLNANFQQYGLPPGTPGTFLTGIPSIAGQLSAAAPLPSPASGFVYVFDPATGVFTQTTASYGPILSERAETIGARRFSLGFVDQYFNFTSLDGIKLSNIPVSAVPNPGTYLAGRYDLHLRLNQFTMYGTYGLNNYLEVSFAAPVLNSQFGGSLGGQLHAGPATATAFATINRSATGIGDLQFQVKANPIHTETAGIAFGANIRTATGDPYSLLGAGAPGIQPFIAASKTIHRWIAPHVNVAYQWNGQSVLAGDVTTGAKSRLPGNASYAAGTELTFGRRFTVAEDIIGTEVFHAPRAIGFSVTLNGVPVQGTDFIRRSFNSTGLSSGLKFNPGGHLLVDFNLLARLNNGGLRAAVVPLVGVSYVFETPTLPKTPTHLPKATAPPENRQSFYQADLDRMVRDLDAQAHFAGEAPPVFIPFHNGHYLRLSLVTTLPKSAAGSQYRVAALAFDQHIAHLIRPVLGYLKSEIDFDGVDFSTSIRLAGGPDGGGTPLAVQFIFPMTLLRSYAQFDTTGQQLIDGGFVLINGERVSLNLQIAEAGFQSQ